MIVVGLSGGLGNQMFQYAAGLALSLRLRASMQLETSWYTHDFSSTDSTPRVIELDQLRTEVRDFTFSPPPTGRVATGRELLAGRRMVTEANHPPERFARIRPTSWGRRTLHLLGYWQDDRYFSSAEPSVRTQFHLSSELTPAERSVSDLIRAHPCIGVHVRRGDYVHHARTSAYHGVPSTEYYEHSVRTLATERDVSRVFVFSDDPGWCKSSLDFGDLDVRVIDQGFPGAVEMRLLSECTHHVLSNSSFSFWGAWLAARAGQRVIAPRSWFADGRPLSNPPTSWQLR